MIPLKSPTKTLKIVRNSVMYLTLVLSSVIYLSACSKPEPAKIGETDDVLEPSKPEVSLQNLAAWPEVFSLVKDQPEVELQIKKILKEMSLEEKVGQIMQAEIQSLQAGDVKKYHLGSVLNGGGSMPYLLERPSASDWLKLADELYDESMDTSDGKVAIPIVWGTDAVHGHNNVVGATIFPHNIGLGATRNPELIEQIGMATAAEVRATGIEWVFAPTLAVAQNDAWGRTYESYAENPSVVAEYAAAMVKGLQGQPNDEQFLKGARAIATAKHFLGDGGTKDGDDQGDARISEQELIAIHNAGYPPAITQGVQTVMASFSSWNGEKMHGNAHLLTEVLKQRMGFDGLVVGDWNGHGQIPGCTNDSCAQAINAGIDLVMVTEDWRSMITNTLAQVQSGEISLARLDDAVSRILRVKIRADLFAAKPSARSGSQDATVMGSASHRAIARKAVQQSLVLLKNNEGILPLSPRQKILVAGDGADDIGKQSGGWTVNWQGVTLSNEKFPGATSIFEGIAAAAVSAGGSAVLSVDGSYTEKPDVAIVVFGENPYAEGQGDVNSLEFEAGQKRSLVLLNSLRSEGIPVVSVFISGRPLWVNPEINASQAFVAAWLPGSEGAGIADVLLAKADGSVNVDFSGRLSFSWPSLPLQTQLNPQQKNYQPLFPYGHGLRYSLESQRLAKLPEDVEGIAKTQSKDIDFYVGRPMQPWNVFIHNQERNQILSGAFAKLPSGDVSIRTSDKDVQEDALTFNYQEAHYGKLTLSGGTPLDLSGHLDSGVMAFDIRVDEFAHAGLSVSLSCGDGCKRSVPLTDAGREWQGKGWQSVRIAMNCFFQAGDDLSEVAAPFSLEVGGTGEIAVANVRFLQEAEPSFTCADYESLSTSPAKLTEFWATEWWEPRHEQVLTRVKQGGVDLLMIGDSITQGWEKEGAKVWQQYYGERNAVNLGFSGDRTENVLWRLQNGEIDGLAPKAAVVLIGTNNTGHRLEKAQYTAEGVRRIVETLRTKLPETRILLLAVFPREAEPEAEMRRLNEELNAQIAGFADDTWVHFLNINAVFLDDDGVLSKSIMPDLLHLNERGYALWAEAMEPLLSKLL